MKIEAVHFSEAVRPESQTLLTQIIADSPSASQLIELAVYEQKLNLKLFQGIDDERPNVELIGIKLSFTRTEYAEIYLEKSAFSHQKTRDLSDFILRINAHGQLELDEDALESWEDDLGFTYSNALCTLIGTKDILLPYIYTYICSDGGEIGISCNVLQNDDDYEDMRTELEAEGISRANLILLTCHYNTREPVHGVRPGFGSHRYIRLS